MATQYYCAATLDGFIAEADDSLNWLTGYEGSYDGEEAQPIKGGYERFYEGIGALVMGSATYEWVLGELTSWPYAGKPTWVLSSRGLPAPPGEDVDVRFVESRARDLHPQLAAAAASKNVWIVGGGNVASQFAEAGLLDEVIVTVVPVVLGSGKPLFERRLEGPLQLAGSRSFDSGMVELRYLVTGSSGP